MDKKKILFFMWSYSLGGGAEKILSTIVRNLPKDKYEIDILEIEHFDKGYEPVSENVSILKSFQSYLQPRWLRAILWRLRIFFPALVRKLLVKDHYDIEVSFTIMNPPLMFSKRKDVKKIAWIHGSIEEFLEDKVKKGYHEKHLKSVDTIVAISNKTRRSIAEVYPEYEDKVEIIYNGYDFNEIIEKSKADIDIDIHQNSICSIGRIEENKGSDRVVEVMNLLHQKGNKYHLYFIGTGEMESELKKKITEYHLEDYIHFLGYQYNPYKYLKNMKVLLSMSKQEGFPGVYVEALSLGVPFVSTDVGGAEELSQDGKFGQVIYSDLEAAQEIKNYVDGNKVLEKQEAREFLSTLTIEEQIKNIEKIF
jgi:glycosyl transferases group 1 family protein